MSDAFESYKFASVFSFGNTVYLKLDKNRELPGLVTGVVFTPGQTTYQITWCDRTDSVHFAFEIERV